MENFFLKRNFLNPCLVGQNLKRKLHILQKRRIFAKYFKYFQFTISLKVSKSKIAKLKSTKSNKTAKIRNNNFYFTFFLKINNSKIAKKQKHYQKL